MAIPARLLASFGFATLGMAPVATPAEVLFDDGKICVQELRFKPGDVGANIVRPFRVVRVLEGGTMRRTLPDGRREDVEYLAGETKVFDRDGPFALENVGATDIVIFVVALKPQ